MIQQKVVAAIDDYARAKKYLMNVGEDKGRIVTRLIDEVRPQTMVELGGYVGYSAILFGAAVQHAGGKRYWCLERNPEFAAVTSSPVDRRSSIFGRCWCVHKHDLYRVIAQQILGNAKLLRKIREREIFMRRDGQTCGAYVDTMSRSTAVHLELDAENHFPCNNGSPNGAPTLLLLPRLEVLV
jgi:hypothetical protein